MNTIFRSVITPSGLNCYNVGGSRSTLKRPTQGWGEHANASQGQPSLIQASQPSSANGSRPKRAALICHVELGEPFPLARERLQFKF
ncbi:uncharacterized protein LOC144025896 isoform X2 [Festucalex cinctus]